MITITTSIYPLLRYYKEMRQKPMSMPSAQFFFVIVFISVLFFVLIFSISSSFSTVLQNSKIDTNYQFMCSCDASIQLVIMFLLYFFLFLSLSLFFVYLHRSLTTNTINITIQQLSALLEWRGKIQ